MSYVFRFFIIKNQSVKKKMQFSESFFSAKSEKRCCVLSAPMLFFAHRASGTR